MADLTLSNADSGKTLTLQPGQTLMLRLNENPTTGYRWSIASFDSQVLQLIDDRFDLPNTTGIGGGGQRIFTFRANQPGDATLHLSNRQAWEPEAAGQESFQVTVRVGP